MKSEMRRMAEQAVKDNPAPEPDGNLSEIRGVFEAGLDGIRETMEHFDSHSPGTTPMEDQHEVVAETYRLVHAVEHAAGLWLDKLDEVGHGKIH